MRVLFYAPLKSPNHPIPSGDRRIARLLREALRAAGCTVCLASNLRSYDKSGNIDRQRRLEMIGAKLAARLLRRIRSGAVAPPDAWLTYHLYHKAPDWLGPVVSAELGIPYVVIEASHAPKQAVGRWQAGYAAARRAIQRADKIICLNPDDIPALEHLLAPSSCAVDRLAPFLNAERWPASRHLTTRPADPSAACSLVTVAMMRDDVKLRSYRMLAEALEKVTDLAWQLHIVGDGEARSAVRRAMSRFDTGRIHWHGELRSEQLAAVLERAEAFVWPALGEAFGMAILEAQACGLPVAAARRPGIAAIVADGETGLLSEEGDVEDFARTLRRLIACRELRRRLGLAARQKIRAEHDIRSAGAKLKYLLQEAVEQSTCTS